LNWDAIGAVAEILGALGVILSVLYLALQIRKDARARVAETSHAIAERAGAVQQILSENRELAACFPKGLRGDFDGLDETDRTQFGAFLSVVTRSYEDAFYQYHEGLIGERLWLAWARSIPDIVCTPGYLAWWGTRKHWFSDDFRTFVDDIIGKGQDRNGVLLQPLKGGLQG